MRLVILIADLVFSESWFGRRITRYFEDKTSAILGRVSHFLNCRKQPCSFSHWLCIDRSRVSAIQLTFSLASCNAEPCGLTGGAAVQGGTPRDGLRRCYEAQKNDSEFCRYVCFARNLSWSTAGQVPSLTWHGLRRISSWWRRLPSSRSSSLKRISTLVPFTRNLRN